MPNRRYFISCWLILVGGLHFLLRIGSRVAISPLTGWALAGITGTVFALVMAVEYLIMFHRGEIAGRERIVRELQEGMRSDRLDILPGKRFGVAAHIAPHGGHAGPQAHARLAEVAQELNTPGWLYAAQSENDPATWMFSVDIDGARFHSPAYGTTPELALRELVMRKRYCNPVAASYREEMETRHAL